ncbi:GerAB/ArcD/ProY family transporter [Tepidibacter mesophilus]|uniref:GerAB/ArcD/ProY family transporter n=1 Tax=Tepidibacter mesophilus TaxID=655607 RepID=UPI0016514E02|nr:endospore germination permease [Tepidibacter mesophilus]
MNKEIISDKQGIAIIVIFIAGTSSIMPLALQAEQNVWLAILLSMIMALIMSLILIKLHIIFSGKNLFDICEICLGKFFGKILIAIFSLYTFNEGVEVLVNNSQFITDTGLPETPDIIIRIFFLILCIWSAKEGIELIGRWSSLFFVPFVFFSFISFILLMPRMDINNMLPILDINFKPVFKAAFASFSFPFGEIVMLSMIFSDFKNEKSYYKIYFLGLLIGGICTLILSLSTILVLGPIEPLNENYSAYSTIAKIDIRDFIQRLEIMSSLIFVIGSFLKFSVLILASCMGFSKIFKIKDYRHIIVPICLLTLNFSFISFKNRMDLIQWNYIAFSYYIFPLEVIFPIMLLITSKLKNKLIKLP